MGTETGTGTGTPTETTEEFANADVSEVEGKYRISEPPGNLREFFDYMGPAWVFTASQIGGGEALSVPIGGAYLGMEAIWLIPLITFTKIFGQYYLVRYGVMSGETFLGALWEQPVWLRWIFVYVFLGGLVYAIGLSGHLGETAGAAQALLPIGTVGFIDGTGFWMIAATSVGVAIVLLRSYNIIERLATAMLWLFLLLVAAASILVADQWIGGLAQGLTPTVPGQVEGLGVGGFAFVMTMFGWIGAGFGPTVAYVWFAKDKVMGMFEAKANGHDIDKEDLEPEEISRLQGWGNVVFWQNVVSSALLAVFSFFMWTAAAGTLHQRGIRPDGFDVVPEMASIFTQVYGEWSAAIFLVAVMATLFSTLLGPLYGMSRLWEDAFDIVGIFQGVNRETLFRITVVLFALVPLVLNLAIEAPLILFAVSGILFAPAVGLMYLAVLYMSFETITMPELQPTRKWAIALAVFAGIALITSGIFEVL